jgi:hypothetical protein
METWHAANVPSLPGPGAEPYLVNTATGRLTRAAAGQRASLYQFTGVYTVTPKQTIKSP